jgi:hypothetical protein
MDSGPGPAYISPELISGGNTSKSIVRKPQWRIAALPASVTT